MTEVPDSAAGSLPRLLVVGCGRVFRRHHLPALQRARGCRVVGLADPDTENLRAAERAFAEVAAAAELGDLLARVDADAALVLTRPATHAALV